MGFMQEAPRPEKLLRYIGREKAVFIAEAPEKGLVEWGETVSVEGSLADRLLDQPTNWELAPKKAKPKPVPEPEPEPEDDEENDEAADEAGE